MRLFISYSRGDSAVAQRLADDLAQQGYQVWLDVRSIPHGANWDNEVQRGLDESDMMLVMLSQSSVSSQNVADEWSYFIDKRKRILPIMLQQCEVPFRLSRRQRVDFTHGYERGFPELLRAIREMPAEDASGTPIGAASSATTYQVSWAGRYNWWRGLLPQATNGEATVLPGEWWLTADRRLPIVIGLSNLTAARVIKRPWDTYLAVTFRDAANKTHNLIVTGTNHRTRTTVVKALHDALRQAAGRALG